MFRHLLRNWLRGAAREQLRQKVVEAAQEQVRATAERVEEIQRQWQSAPCDLGLVFALGVEAAGLDALFEDVVTTRGRRFRIRQGLLCGKRAAVVVSGAGRAAAAEAAEALITGHRPRWVISAGFAGGLAPHLKRNDVVMADQLVDAVGEQLSVDLKVDPAALAESPGVYVGRLLTADRVVRWPDQKRSLFEKHGALAVDMETFGVAEVCSRRRVRFLAVRAITDAADEQLPGDVGHLAVQRTRAARLGAATRAIWRRPSSLKDMRRLSQTARQCSNRLARFLAGMIEQL